MSDETLWITQPRTWALAMDRAARDLPRWTKAWWRRTAELYQKMGGKLLEDDEAPDTER